LPSSISATVDAFSDYYHGLLTPLARVIDEHGYSVIPTLADSASHRKDALTACKSSWVNARRDIPKRDFFSDANGDHPFVWPLSDAFVAPVLVYFFLTITMRVFSITGRWIREGFRAI
jgi:hypothetical protein